MFHEDPGRMVSNVLDDFQLPVKGRQTRKEGRCMTRLSRNVVFAGVVIGLFVGSAFAAAPGAPPSVVTACAACHGPNGVSMVPTFPDLAAQGAPYLIKQIRDFQSHKRADPLAQSVMWAMAAAIPKNKIKEVADYFANQKGAPGVSENPKLVEAGRELYMGGLATNHLPACMACHGPTGRGLPPLFPRLAGQHIAYVTAQLGYFKTKQRTNDPLGIMQTIAAKLSTKQMTELAEFIRTL
ncbi:MAG: c-type cytochrome [Acidiferrobacteraceae bacterium]